jgi:hypothetical protein
MSGWLPRRGDMSPVCVARSWRCWLALRLDIKATEYLYRLAGSNTAAIFTQALKTVANNRSGGGGGRFHLVLV